MDFTVFNTNITKDFILSKVNQETIMQYYTNKDVNSKKLFTSLFRNDNHVTCSFWKSKSGVLYIHDFATNEHINCFQVVMRLYNCGFYEALKIIATDFRLIEGTLKVSPKEIVFVPEIKETSNCIIQVQVKEFSKEELEWWNSYGISNKLLKKYHVFSLQHVFLNGELKFTSTYQCPIYGYYFGKDKNGKELWKIYFPNNKEKGIRFLNNLPTKKLQGYKQLPKTGDLLVITKSMKDVISMRAFGISAVAPSSESTFCSKEQVEEFKERFKRIIVMYDQDRPGKHNMWKIRNEYPELEYFLIPKDYNSKDFSDLVKNYGIEKIKTLILEFLIK